MPEVATKEVTPATEESNTTEKGRPDSYIAIIARIVELSTSINTLVVECFETLETEGFDNDDIRQMVREDLVETDIVSAGNFRVIWHRWLDKDLPVARVPVPAEYDGQSIAAKIFKKLCKDYSVKQALEIIGHLSEITGLDN